MLQWSLEFQKYFLSYWEYTLKGTLCGYAKINVLVLEANVWVSKKPHSYV